MSSAAPLPQEVLPSLSPATEEDEPETQSGSLSGGWWRRLFALGRRKPRKAGVPLAGGAAVGDPKESGFLQQAQHADQQRAAFSVDFQGRSFFEEGSGLALRHRRTMTEEDIHREFSSPDVANGFFEKVKRQARGFSFRRCLRSAVPLEEALRTYKLKYLLPDLFSGISEGVMAIPQGMSYAMLARLPPQFGLYVNFIYPLIYMIFGTGRHVAVGVSAIEDLLLGESVTRIIGEREKLEDIALTRSLAGDPKTSLEVRQTLLETANLNETLLTESRVAISIGMSVCVGIVYALMRILQAGLLADLLAVPVLSGFSTASAFLIGTSQLKHAFGLSIPASVEDADFKLVRQWWYCASHIHQANWVSGVICITSICILAFCKFLNRRYFKSIPLPGPLLIVIIFTALSAGLKLESTAGIRVIGDIPRGFPSPAAPKFSTNYAVISEGGEPFVVSRNVFLMMLREALALTAMFFVIHISVAKTITQQKKTYHIRPDQELVAMSCCNFVGSCFQCFPNATSLSRTCVVATTGGFTQLHQISNALVLVFTLSFMTPWLYSLPNAVLAAVVLFGVYGMLDFKEFIRLAKIGGLDVLLWLVCFLITIIFGAMEGILASVLLSLLWLLRKTARPACIVLGRLPETQIYRNVKRFPMAIEEEGVRILRFDSSLNFSNSDFFESRVMQALLPSTKVVIMDGSSINDMDVTAIRMLERLVQSLRGKGILLLFANWKGPMRDFLQKASFYDVLPPEYCFLSIPDAVFWAKRRLRLADPEVRRVWTSGHLTGPLTRWLQTCPLAASSTLVVVCILASSVFFPLCKGRAVQAKGTQRSKSALTLQLDGEANRQHEALRRRSTCSQSLTSLQGLEGDLNNELPAHRCVLWDGLSARTMEGLRVVTEITGSGRPVRWTVCTTGQQEEGIHPTQQGLETSTPSSTTRQLNSQPGSENNEQFFSSKCRYQRIKKAAIGAALLVVAFSILPELQSSSSQHNSRGQEMKLSEILLDRQSAEEARRTAGTEAAQSGFHILTGEVGSSTPLPQDEAVERNLNSRDSGPVWVFSGSLIDSGHHEEVTPCSDAQLSRLSDRRTLLKRYDSLSRWRQAAYSAFRTFADTPKAHRITLWGFAMKKEHWSASAHLKQLEDAACSWSMQIARLLFHLFSASSTV
ncbi:hypothetical protein Efla_002229 [Eimeria flavescens]